MPRSARLSPSLIPDAAPSIDVVVGILEDGNGRVLIGRRPEGKPMAGHWEFPGGKLEPAEPPRTGLARELAEELGIRVGDAEPFLEREVDYPGLNVRLDVWWVLRFAGRVAACEGQALRWVNAEALAEARMLPADAPIVRAVCARLMGR